MITNLILENKERLQNLRLCILGRPGSGKGTICRLLLDVINSPKIQYYNVGQILRDRASEDEHIKIVHAAGGLVQPDRVLNIFDDALTHEAFILDGSPRRPEEADFILNHANWKSNPGILIHLWVPDRVAIERLTKRERFDDTLEVIQSRFASFNETTMESIKKFQSCNQLIEVDATREPIQVVHDILYEVLKRGVCSK